MITRARGLLRRGIERVLAHPGITRFTSRRVRGRTLILAYHGVVPADAGGAAAGERSLHIGQARFAAQLDVLADVADVAPLAELDRPGDGRPRVAITFDDAYDGALTAGVAELVTRGLPATFFVAPGRLGGHVFWWDAIAHATGELAAAVRAHALDVLRGEDEPVRAWAREQRLATVDELPAYARAASAGTLQRAARQPGITFGSHSWSHPNLSRLSNAECAEELRRTSAWLHDMLGDRAIPWLAYPYGLESAAVRQAAADAGYAGAVRIAGGWHRPREVSPFARPRLNIPAGRSVEGFRARVLGTLLP